jgi:hypothetical protein
VELRVSRPEYALVRAAEAGRADRLAAFVRKRGVDRDLLHALLSRSQLAGPRRDDLKRAVGEL